MARVVVGQHRYDGVPRPKLAREPDRPGDVDARGSPEAEALVLEQIENERHGLRVGNLIGDVDRCAFHVLGDATLPDPFRDRGAFGFKHAGGVVAVERGAERIGKSDLDGPVALLERDADTRDRAAGADRAGEAIDLAVGLVPYFMTSRLQATAAVRHLLSLLSPT